MKLIRSSIIDRDENTAGGREVPATVEMTPPAGRMAGTFATSGYAQIEADLQAVSMEIADDPSAASRALGYE